MLDRMLVGLIGANIQGSISPALFEDACAGVGVRGHYHLMDLDRLPSSTLAGLLHGCRAAGFRGVNITYPCKQAVLPFLDEVSAEARDIGAANTVVFSEGRMIGHNTDRVGFRNAFGEELGRSSAEGKTLTLVGAGGAGRAVAFALFDLGAEMLLVHDTRPEQSAALVEALAARFGAGRARIAAEAEHAVSVSAGVVNATPVGMPGIAGNPLPMHAITRAHWVADVIYTPLETECLEAARARGARVMNGAGMCVHQAAETFRLFTGIAPRIDRFRAAFFAAAAEREKV